jgi:hypothetical protein
LQKGVDMAAQTPIFLPPIRANLIKSAKIGDT